MTWAKTWLVSFNPQKTESLLISRKLNKALHSPLFMENQIISEVESHKHLYVCLSNDCSWHKHIDYIKEKAWGRINVMRRLKFSLDRKSLETIYLTFIRPYFTPDYVQSVARLMMISFRNASQIHLSVSVENTDHYFMPCPLYRKQRAELNQKISQHS